MRIGKILFVLIYDKQDRVRTFCNVFELTKHKHFANLSKTFDFYNKIIKWSKTQEKCQNVGRI